MIMISRIFYNTVLYGQPNNACICLDNTSCIRVAGQRPVPCIPYVPLCKSLTVPQNALSSGQFHAFSLYPPQYRRFERRRDRQVAFERALWRLHVNTRWGFDFSVKDQGVCKPFCPLLVWGFCFTVWLTGLFICALL